MKAFTKLGIFAFSFLILQSCIVSQSPQNTFFDNPYYDTKEAKFVSVNVPMWIAKPLIKKTLREDGESEELINLVRKVKDVKILTVENGNKEMLKDFVKQLASKNFQEWMTIKKDGQNINFQAKQEGETIKKLMISVNSGNELVFVDVKGNFTADDISKIINYSEKTDIKKVVLR